MRDRAGKGRFLPRGVQMTRTTKIWLLCGAAMMGALCINTAAHAQSETGASASTDVITVTARRREENLQDTPVSVTAFTGDMLEEAQIFNNATDEVYPIAGNSSLGTGSGYAEIAYDRGRTWYIGLETDL
jgi:outer membrane receptor protein involved in Fe transport